MSPLLFLAPLFLAFEMWQLVISERYLGLKRIEQGADPRELGLGEGTAFCWSAGIFAYWAWMLLLLFQPVGRAQVLCLLVVSALGLSLRRNCGLRWVLVILTLEGAIRIGMLFSLAAVAWRGL